MAYNLANEYEEPMDKEEVESPQEEQTEPKYNIAYIASCLLDIRDNVHIAHLQSKSYAEHIALNELYDNILGLFDSLVESWQGKYGIVTGYTSPKIQEGVNIIKYLESKIEEFVEFGEEQKDTYIKSELDIIVETIYSTLYKLKNLK